MENIQSFVISTDKNKFKNLEEKLRNIGFKNVNHFPAIMGEEIKNKLLNNRNVLSYRAEHEITNNKLREAHSSIPSWGGAGCYLSHLELWKKAIENGKGVLIFEEDADFSGKDILNKLNKDFKTFLQQSDSHIFSIGHLGHSGLSKIKGNLLKSKGLIYGLQGYYITKKGAEILLKDALPMEVQVDTYIGYKIQKNELGFYTVSYNPIKQNIPSGTSIQTKGVQMPYECYNNNKTFIVILFLLAVILFLVFYS